MGRFQKIVLISAILILIIALLIIGVSLIYYKKTNWPPNVSACPDWWVLDGSGNNQKCINIKDLGVCKPQGNARHQTMDFNLSPFTGTNGTCNKYTWANRCNVSWDGITYGVTTNPCSTTSTT